VRAFALVELGDSDAIDLFLREEDARAAREDAIGDERKLGRPAQEPIELDGREVCVNHQLDVT
jgi:hypothetical protein